MIPSSINPAGYEQMMPGGSNASGHVCPLCGCPLPMPYNQAGAPQGMPGQMPMPLAMPPSMPGGVGDSELLQLLMGGMGNSSGGMGAAAMSPPAMMYQ